MKVLELFAGLGACSKALERLGIEHEIVDAVEIDKYAIASFNAIHGTNFETQDITEWDKDVEVDLIMHGSPCQDFSVAGKQAGGDIGSGTRSSLMYETIRIVGKLRPKYVIWENVKNLLSEKHRHNFDAYLETMKALGYTNYYQVLNAKDYGIPQNRERVFTISILGEHKPFVFHEKQELKIRLKDILDDVVEEKFYLKDYQIKNIVNSNFAQKNKLIQEKDVCDTLLARDYKDPKCVQVGTLDIKGMDCIKRVYSGEGLSPTLTNMQGGNRQPKVITAAAMRGRYNEDKVEQHIEVSDREYANAITTVQKDSLVVVDNNIKPSVAKNYKREAEQISKSDKEIYQCECESGWQDNKVGIKVSPTIRHSSNHTCVYNDYRIRKLTPKECWRLMGFDDEDFEKASKVCSNSQLYKQAGNSIVVNVLVEIFRKLLN
jgi:DNA (cytosine-5)-methyltransferase 1